jgi:SOS response regulatory protein OraA/RecX
MGALMRESCVVQSTDEIKADLKRAKIDQDGIEQALEVLRQEQQEAQKAYDKMLRG